MKQLKSFIQTVRRNSVVQRLARRKLVIALVMIGCMAVTVLYTARMPVTYRSTASVLLESSGRSFRDSDGSAMITADAAKAQRGLAESRPVIERMCSILNEKIPGATPNVRLPAGFRSRVDGQLLYLQVDDTDSARAAKRANAWATAYIDEMTQRAPSFEAKKILDKTVPSLQQQWVKKQESLNNFERETNYHTSEFEQSPTRKSVDELTARLNQKNIELAGLLAEQDVLKSTSSLETLAQLPRAKKDTGLQGTAKLVDDWRTRWLETRETYKADSPQVKAAEESLRMAKAEYTEAIKSLAMQVEIEVATVEGERNRIASLLQQAEKDLDKLKSTAASHRVLRAEAQMAERLYSELAQKKSEADVSQNFQFFFAKPWEWAEESPVAVSPAWRRNLVLGFLLSIFMALAAVRLCEILDTTVMADSSLERKTGLSTLGAIPASTIVVSGKESFSLARRLPDSALSASMRNLCATLELRRLHGSRSGGLVITVTSPGTGEGKSFVASNLATAFSNSSRKTLLVDADFGQGTLSRAFECAEQAGLCEKLASGEWSSNWAVNGSTPGYKLLPIGGNAFRMPLPLNPENLSVLLQKMKKDFEVIIFDTPSVLMLPVACVTGRHSDATLLVCRQGFTQSEELDRAVERLKAANLDQLHLVVNEADVMVRSGSMTSVNA